MTKRSVVFAGVLSSLVAGVALAGPGAGVEVCHRPPGNAEGARTLTVSKASLDAHLAHGDAEGACDAVPSCPCFDMAMLEALGAGTYGQQRWEVPDREAGGNWVGVLVGGDGFAQVLWDEAGTSTCNYADWSDTQVIDLESALACDALLNELSLAVGAICSSAYCP